MAAATDKEEIDFTRSIKILDGEMNFTIYAGLETGLFVINLIKD